MSSPIIAAMSALRDFLRTPTGRFVALYAVILTAGFTVLALDPVNDSVVNGYTTFVAHQARLALLLLGERATVEGQVLASPRFSVAIHNGCNGLEAILIFVCGVLAFPSPWRRKLLGMAVGFVAIQLFNIVRIVALFYTGVFRPDWFGVSHVFVWQSLVVVFAAGLWVFWVQRYARPEATS
ncbi:MAG TPA: exosortase H [Thermoanaerobaculaceae bacterium]|nr:exosortase H [Thermoanaerobaculaceae bacterium]